MALSLRSGGSSTEAALESKKKAVCTVAWTPFSRSNQQQRRKMATKVPHQRHCRR